jgi:beta-aspartyl-peptidase (threonine type)
MKYILLVITGMILAMNSVNAETRAPTAIAIHGGAGTIKKSSLDAEREAQLRGAMEAALKAGHEVLESGGTALDAVSTAVSLLEDTPYFNAGKGAVFNAEGKNELDASIMDGNSRNAGAVAAVHTVKNPIQLARLVLSDSPHVMLIGDGAEEFGRQHGIEFVDPSYFHTDYRWQQLQKARAEHDTAEAGTERWYSTVGAVALDQDGNLAAATSTGGTTNKRWGRVGDSPIIGAGTYADNRSCAVSATGTGEYFIRSVVAYDICARVYYQDISLDAAARTVVMEELPRMGGDGGVISMDAAGNIAMIFNTAGMYRASIGTDGKMTIKIYGDEESANN